MNSLRTYTRAALALIFGERCVVCGQMCTGAKICPKCLLKLPYINIRGVEDGIIERLFWGILPVERVGSMLMYAPNNSAQNILRSIKYSGRSDLAVDLGRMMAVEFGQRGFFDDVDCIQPVPLHPNRERKRGYNQSRQLAKGIAEMTHLPVVDLIRRSVDNVSQTSLNHTERINNVKGIFLPKTEELERLRPRHILFVDDVITTGSTLISCIQSITGSPEECFRQEATAGGSALKVSILSLAYAGQFCIGHRTPEELKHPLQTVSNVPFRNLQRSPHPI